MWLLTVPDIAGNAFGRALKIDIKSSEELHFHGAQHQNLEIQTYHGKPNFIKDAYQHKTWQKKLTIALSCYYWGLLSP